MIIPGVHMIAPGVHMIIPGVHMIAPRVHMKYEMLVDRCGMVYIDADELKWMPYVVTWMHQFESKLKDEVRTYLLDLFERYVEAGLRFVSKKCTQVINQVRCHWLSLAPFKNTFNAAFIINVLTGRLK